MTQVTDRAIRNIPPPPRWTVFFLVFSASFFRCRRVAPKKWTTLESSERNCCLFALQPENGEECDRSRFGYVCVVYVYHDCYLLYWLMAMPYSRLQPTTTRLYPLLIKYQLHFIHIHILLCIFSIFIRTNKNTSWISSFLSLQFLPHSRVAEWMLKSQGKTGIPVCCENDCMHLCNVYIWNESGCSTESSRSSRNLTGRFS